MHTINPWINQLSIVFWLLLGIHAVSFAQGVGINDYNAPPDSSAMLDVASTTKGVLIPRMSSTERTNISSPATGLLVFDQTTASFWYYNGSQWTEIEASHTALSPFDTAAGVVLPNIALIDETTYDFVFGSTQLDGDGNADHYRRLFFDKSKGAFRAGYTTDASWDESNLGGISTAFGVNNTASGSRAMAWGDHNTVAGSRSTAWGNSNTTSGSLSTAWGEDNTVAGTSATAWGEDCIASGNRSTAWGWESWATGTLGTAWGHAGKATNYGATTWGYSGDAGGEYATAWGYNSNALAKGATAWGEETDATGAYATAWGSDAKATSIHATAWGKNAEATDTAATAWGQSAKASGNYATAFGNATKALGNYSTTWGGNAEASGEYATAAGWFTTAPSFVETAIGYFNTAYTPIGTDSWNDNDRLFSIGNGTGHNNRRSNALTIYKDGTMNINDAYNMPTTDGGNGAVMMTDGNGQLSWMNPTALADDQTLSLAGTNLTITDGNTVDLASLSDDLGNHTATTNLQTAGHYLSNDGDDEGIFIDEDGHVGIGSYSPDKAFHVKNAAPVARFESTDNGRYLELNPASSTIDLYNANFNINRFAPTDIIMAAGGGNVGIGLGSGARPNAKLQVGGTVNTTLSSFAYLNPNGNIGKTNGSGTRSLSIYADGEIAGSKVIAHSDRRIKTNFSHTNNTADLKTLMDIQITNYHFIDQATKGDQPEKKVIAQELKAVYPQAVVDNITQVVPDIMQFAPIQAGWVSLEQHTLKVGDWVRLIHATGAAEFEVLGIKENAFQVAFEGTEQVLVYGRQVNDFHTVDYDAVAMLNVSATQAQQQLIQQLQQENATLKAQQQAQATALQQLQADQAQLKQLQTSQAHLQAQLNELKALLQMSASK